MTFRDSATGIESDDSIVIKLGITIMLGILPRINLSFSVRTINLS